MRCAAGWRWSKKDSLARCWCGQLREKVFGSDGAGMANIKADEISKILREQIENYEQTVSVDEVGAIISVGDGIARVYGLEKVMSGEMLAFPHDVYGIALNLEEEEVGVVLLGESQELKEGDVVKRT